MKKLITLIMLAFVSLGISAQANPNRLIVVNKSGNIKSYLVEHLDSIIFKKIEGDVSVAIEVHKYDDSDSKNKKLIVSFTRSEECNSFRYAVLPKIIADNFKEDYQIASLMDASTDQQYYYEDFTQGEVNNMELLGDAEYTVLATAYDKYGTACRGTKADFKTPAPKLVGNPSVEFAVEGVTENSITMAFNPNDDCASYSYCLFEKGTAEKKLAQFASMFGLVSMKDMVAKWGEKNTSSKVHTWNQDIYPATDYEIYILPIDVNGSYGELQIANARTLTIGGDGVAQVDIKIGEFGGNSMEGYWQMVTYTPNDQTLLHRDFIVKKSAFTDGTWTEESFVEKYMKLDNNPNFPEGEQDPNWNCYGVDEAQWNAEPDTEYYAFSIAKNAKGEYGPVAKKEFKTGKGGVVSGNKMANPIMKRLNDNGIVEKIGGKVAKRHMTLSK